MEAARTADGARDGWRTQNGNAAGDGLARYVGSSPAASLCGAMSAAASRAEPPKQRRAR